MESSVCITLCNFSRCAASREQCFCWGRRQGFKHLFGINSPVYEAEQFSHAARVPALGTESGGGGSCSCSFTWASWQRALQDGWCSARCHQGVRATGTLRYGLPLLRGCQRLQVFSLAQGTCLPCATLAASHASHPSLAPRWPSAEVVQVGHIQKMLVPFTPVGPLGFLSKCGFPGLCVCWCWLGESRREGKTVVLP